jgi:biopolymer transport protein ExbD
MHITRRRRQGAVISLVAMVDVLMIMLVFFMVTSTFLDLDMIPMAERAPDVPVPELAQGAPVAAPGSPVMVRLGADGRSYLRGRALDDAALTAALRAPDLRGAEVLVLPSGQADVQALVRVMDAIARAEPPAMRILRVDARP